VTFGYLRSEAKWLHLYCTVCGHDVSKPPFDRMSDSTVVPTLGQSMVCSRCGTKGNGRHRTSSSALRLHGQTLKLTAFCDSGVEQLQVITEHPVLFAALSDDAVRVIAGDLPRGDHCEHVVDTIGDVRDIVRYASALCDQSLKAQMPTHDRKLIVES
jgi:hypothetical protein